MQLDNPNETTTSDMLFNRKCLLQIQYKQHVEAVEQTQVRVDKDALNLIVRNKTCDFIVKISYIHMLSVAKNTKTGQSFKLIIFVNDGNGDAQQFEEFQDEEDEEEGGELCKEMQIIKNIQQLRIGNNSDLIKGINLIGCFTVTITFNETSIQSNKEENSFLSQLQKHVANNDKRNVLHLECEQLYERIVGQLNKLEDSKNGQNSNKGISSLLMAQQNEAEDNDEWEDQQAEMDMEQ